MSKTHLSIRAQLLRCVRAQMVSTRPSTVAAASGSFGRKAAAGGPRTRRVPCSLTALVPTPSSRLLDACRAAARQRSVGSGSLAFVGNAILGCCFGELFYLS